MKFGIYLFSFLIFSCCSLIAGEISMAPKKTLKTYKKKRNLKKSGEPAGGKATKKGDKIFVIQEHNASHLHFDFRIEIDGVLVSWAVPKGPSLNPDDKRFAAQTEDHPMDYANFEGIIPEGYGAGQVIVWDKGTYKNLRSVSMEQSLKDGKIEIFLDGKKLQGAFALIRMHLDDNKKSWLFFKVHDEYADKRKNIIKSEPESIRSGKTIEELAKEDDDVVRRPHKGKATKSKPVKVVIKYSADDKEPKSKKSRKKKSVGKS